MARRKIIRDPRQASFELILQEDSRLEARQRENDRRLLEILNSCSIESRNAYADLLRH